MASWNERFRAWAAKHLRAHLTPIEVAKAVGIGVYIGCLPIYGLHLPVCVFVARRYKLNQAIVYAAANISNPFFAPFLVTAEIAVGEWLRREPFDPSGAETVSHTMIWDLVQRAPSLLVSCLIGSQLVGVVLAFALFGIVLFAARLRERFVRAPVDV